MKLLLIYSYEMNFFDIKKIKNYLNEIKNYVYNNERENIIKSYINLLNKGMEYNNIFEEELEEYY